jgi:hypothetical protein
MIPTGLDIAVSYFILGGLSGSVVTAVTSWWLSRRTEIRAYAEGHRDGEHAGQIIERCAQAGKERASAFTAHAADRAVLDGLVARCERARENLRAACDEHDGPDDDAHARHDEHVAEHAP